MSSEIEEIIETLKTLSLETINKDEIITMIRKISLSSSSSSSSSTSSPSSSSSSSSNNDGTINNLDNYDLTDIFIKLLSKNDYIDDDDKDIHKEINKCIAEITKNESQRKKFTNKNIINILIDIIKNIHNDIVIKKINRNNNDIELLTQICRALGNICYSNEDARNIIVCINGDEYLINLLDIEAQCDNQIDIQFIKVRGGLISNYLLGEENLAKRAMNYKIMDKIQYIINKCCENTKDIEKYEDLLLNTLPPLSILTENVSDLNFDNKLNIQLAQILAASKNPDLAEMCLELLHYQAENDDVKLLLAKEGLCETIYCLLEKYKTLASSNGARALMKLACDLIVLILTGDESMHYLYTTPLLKNMEDWLDSYDIDLLTTGVLALGNFARTDSHCIYMVENKIMDKLLAILSKNNGVDDNMKLQHALLSALRNLVIPKPNKGAVIQAGLVQTILPMLEIHQPPVVFKLLGTLRMTVDGQEKLALELLQNKTLIEQLVNWSKSSDFACVTGESLRLMAWLIKHAYQSKDKENSSQSTETTTSTTEIAAAATSSTVTEESELCDEGAIGGSDDRVSSIECYRIDETSLKAFVMTDGAVESMINMLTSQHLVMQNEALIALSILSSIFLFKNNYNDNNTESNINLVDLYVKYELGKKLAEFIKRSSDNMTKEIVENLQTFTTLLKQSDKLIKHLEEHSVNELLKSIPILTEYCTL